MHAPNHVWIRIRLRTTNIPRDFAFVNCSSCSIPSRYTTILGASFYQLAQDDEEHQVQTGTFVSVGLAACKARAGEFGVNSLGVVKPVVARLHDEPE
ncbi:hypothetical protein BCR44DRAFT_40689 [Catenaria anguillulae PL171]|uniref:Uncharacterized protein n=1 Tax=Catenaria anguillulae PL171 TaxID=765915 RepID=A0A1Y2HB40_9FUNG|nr:hypothetical protein BCR44DRAFT_40689 [Catenaria anguillulae PL171]